MGLATSREFGLPGNNRIWISLSWSERLSGTTNTVNIKMTVHTKYMIAGTWTCRLRVNGATEAEGRVGMYWGDYSSGGSKTVFEINKSFTYSGHKSITIEGAILNMDYYDITLGTSSTRVQNLIFPTSASLATTNTPPPKPSISCTNQVVNGNYLGENTIDITLSRVKDPQGDPVTYVIYAEYLPPGGGTWLNAGDANKCILYSSNNSVSKDITGYARGTRFRVWGLAKDSHGASAGTTGYISNIYRNRTPNRVSEIRPSSGIFNNDFTISWSNPGDPDGNTPTFNLWLSKNGGAYSKILSNSSATSYTQSIGSDPEGTTYTYSIATTDGLTESPYIYSATYRKNTRPTTPAMIFPNSGFYLGNVSLSWNASTDPDGRGIKHYNVYINNVYIGSTTNTNYTWYIPDGDAPESAYRVSIVAVDVDDKASDVGYASGHFYKAKPPTPPSWISPAETYHESHINLNWENVSSNGAGVTYNLDYKINDGGWARLASSIRSPNYRHDIRSITRGSKINYRVMCANSFGQTSAYKESMSYYRNRIPNAPVIDYPLNNSVIYNINPKIAINILREPDNQGQTIYIECNGTTYNSKDHKSMFSKQDGLFSGNTKIIFFAPNLNYGDNVISVYANDGFINSSKTVRRFSVSKSRLIARKDEIIFSDLFIKTREQINTVRSSYGLHPYNFIHKVVEGGAIKVDHINEMIVAISEPRAVMNNYDGVQNGDVSSNWLEPGVNDYILKDYLQQIIDVMKHI